VTQPFFAASDFDSGFATVAFFVVFFLEVDFFLVAFLDVAISILNQKQRIMT